MKRILIAFLFLAFPAVAQTGPPNQIGSSNNGSPGGGYPATCAANTVLGVLGTPGVPACQANPVVTSLMGVSNPGSSGTNNAITLNNTNGTNFKNEIQLQASGINKWSIGNDINHAGNQDFFIFDFTAGTRFKIDNAGSLFVGTGPGVKFVDNAGDLFGVQGTFTGALTASPANANDVFSPTGTGTVTINPATAGTLNNMSLGATTRSTAAVTTLAANSTVTFPGLATSSSATTGTVCWTTGTGNLNVDTTTTCLLSSGKYKKDWQPLDSGLNEVMALQPGSYELKAEYNPSHLGRQIGFLAEDVYKVDPRLVSLEDDGSPHAVRYMQMTAVLANAIQQQQHEIEDLKARSN